MRDLTKLVLLLLIVLELKNAFNDKFSRWHRRATSCEHNCDRDDSPKSLLVDTFLLVDCVYWYIAHPYLSKLIKVFRVIEITHTVGGLISV